MNRRAGPAQAILLIEDESKLRRMVQENLEIERYKVWPAGSAEEALPLVARERPDLIVLDVMLPGESGFDFCKRLRRDGVRTPVLMLTARAQEGDKVLGLELGADDYLTKPFGLPEFLARVRALLRRAAPAEAGPETCTFGDREVDFRRRTLRRGKTEEFLTHFETELLAFLVRRKGEVLSRAQILQTIWGEDLFPSTRTVDNFIVNLRQKIERNPKRPAFIQTVHGTGYRLVMDA